MDQRTRFLWQWVAPMRLLTGLTVGLWVFLSVVASAGAQGNPVPLAAEKRTALLQELTCYSAPAPAGIMGLMVLKADAPAFDPFENLIGDPQNVAPLFLSWQVLERSTPYGGIGLGKFVSGWQQVNPHGQEAASKVTRNRITDPRIGGNDTLRDELDRVRDRQPLASPEAADASEYFAYCRLIVLAREAGGNLLHQYARTDVLWANLMAEPKKHRGQIVEINGSLRRLIRWEAPELKQFGVSEYYEGWIKTDSHMYCVVFSQLPPGLEVGEKLSVPVTFDGYFFKRLRYSSEKMDKDKKAMAMEAPMLVGATLIVPTPATSSESEMFSSGFLIALLSVIGVTIGLAIILAWLYRRGDRAVESRLAAARHATFVPPGEEDASTDIQAVPPASYETERGSAPHG